jgi:hypothetical protein
MIKIIEVKSKEQAISIYTELDIEERFTKDFRFYTIYRDEEDKNEYNYVLQKLNGENEVVKKIVDGDYNRIYVAFIGDEIDSIYFFMNYNW